MRRPGAARRGVLRLHRHGGRSGLGRALAAQGHAGRGLAGQGAAPTRPPGRPPPRPAARATGRLRAAQATALLYQSTYATKLWPWYFRRAAAAQPAPRLPQAAPCGRDGMPAGARGAQLRQRGARRVHAARRGRAQQLLSAGARAALHHRRAGVRAAAGPPHARRGTPRRPRQLSPRGRTGASTCGRMRCAACMRLLQLVLQRMRTHTALCCAHRASSGGLPTPGKAKAARARRRRPVLADRHLALVLQSRGAVGRADLAHVR